MKHISEYSPTTSLLFVGDRLCVGRGSELLVYDWREARLLAEYTVFARNKIHGIRALGSKLVLWGGSSLAVLDIDSPPSPGSYPNTRIVYDWIISAEFAYHDPTRIYAQTAHNEILVVSATDLSTAAQHSSMDKSILYSGTILPLADKTLVAAGTVLGGIVVWDMLTGETVQTMTSHFGSIFGVRFSDDGSQLVSCSDDRSIRLWDVVSGSELAVGWGHLARIWQLHFLDAHTILSVSEDCTARVWRPDVSKNVLNCDIITEGHQGRNIWAAAYTHVGSNCVVATGGGDGRVLLWNLNFLSAIESSRTALKVAAISPISKSEAFKEYCSFGNGLLVATSAARLLLCTGPVDSPQFTGLDDITIDTYSIVRGFNGDSSIACVATREGTIYILDASRSDGSLVKSRIDTSFEGKISTVLTFETSLHRKLLLVQTQHPADMILIYDLEGTLVATLNHPTPFITTSVAFSTATSLLWLGSRHGSVMVFSLDLHAAVDSVVEPVQTWPKAISEDAITSVSLLSDSELLLTSRLGEHSVFGIDLEKNALTVLSSSRLPRGSIEGCQIIRGKTIFYGFRNDMFFIWNETDQLEVMNERCGGPHRTWHLALDQEDETVFTLKYTKASELYSVNSARQSLFAKSVVMDGFHGREIRGIEFSSKQTRPGSGELILASGAEDTCIKLSTLSRGGQLRVAGTYAQHTSGIQALHWSPDDEYLLSSAAREELIVWRVSNLESGLFACPVSRLPTSSNSPDLRIMEFDTVRIGSEYLLATVYSDSTIKIWTVDLAFTTFTLVAETRYRHCCLLNCHFLPRDDSSYSLAVSSTDGHLVFWPVLVDGEVRLGEQELSVRLHQSSVKSSFFSKVGEQRYLHVSGGDDNALVVAAINIGATGTKCEGLVTLESAHLAAITGVALVDAQDLTFVSVSSDQVVRHWTAGLSDDQIFVSPLDSKYTTVADTGVTTAVKFPGSEGHIVAVGGAGVSFWQA